MNAYESPVIVALFTRARRFWSFLLLLLLAVFIVVMVGTHSWTVQQVADHVLEMLLTLLLGVVGMRR